MDRVTLAIRAVFLRTSLALTAAGAIGLGIAAPCYAAATPMASLKDLMTKIVEPTSNAIFYVSRQPPQTDEEWKSLQGQTLMLNEIAIALMTPARAKDRHQWMVDAKALLEASATAYQAASARDMTALEDLNEPLYNACTGCHEHYPPKR